MKYFSMVEFGSDLYILPGKVDNYALSSFNPLLEVLATLETSEKVLVHCTYSALGSDEPGDRDLKESEIDDVVEQFDDLLSSNEIKLLEEYDYELEGVLDEPFEKFYELKGEDLETYLKTKKEFLDAQEELRRTLEEVSNGQNIEQGVEQ